MSFILLSLLITFSLLKYNQPAMGKKPYFNPPLFNHLITNYNDWLKKKH